MQKIKQRCISVLRWLEKYAKTDLVYVTRGSFWSTLSQIVVTFSSFLLSIAFAYFVSKEAYGQYKYILSLVGILSTFTLTGLNLATTQSIIRGFEGTLKYAFWQNIKWSVLFFLSAFGSSIYYFWNGNSSFGISILVVGCLWPFFTSTNYYACYLTAKKDFRRNAIYFDIIGNLFPYVCLLVVMFSTSNPVWLIVTYIVSNTFIGIILYRKVVRIYNPNKKVDPEIISYSKHLSLTTILGGFSANIDQILVFHYIGPAQLAIYNFATAIPNQIKGPIKNLGSLIFLKFTERSNSDIRSGMKNKMMLLFLGIVVVIVVYIVVVPYFFHIFFPKYSDSILYSQIFSLSLLYVISVPANTYLTAKKKVKEQYVQSVSGLIVQIILLAIGIIYWGLMGLVLARVVIRLAWAFIAIVLYNEASKQKLSD